MNDFMIRTARKLYEVDIPRAIEECNKAASLLEKRNALVERRIEREERFYKKPELPDDDSGGVIIRFERAPVEGKECHDKGKV